MSPKAIRIVESVVSTVHIGSVSSSHAKPSKNRYFSSMTRLRYDVVATYLFPEKNDTDLPVRK